MKGIFFISSPDSLISEITQLIPKHRNGKVSHFNIWFGGSLFLFFMERWTSQIIDLILIQRGICWISARHSPPFWENVEISEMSERRSLIKVSIWFLPLLLLLSARFVVWLAGPSPRGPTLGSDYQLDIAFCYCRLYL